MTTNMSVEKIIEKNMMEYSSYVLLDRAIPDYRDGLKPVHRRVLYTMLKMGATKLTKSANVAGEVMKFHPHGSSYGTMVGMVQTDRQLVPMLIGKGNFGMHTSRDLAPAAERYSEVKLADVSIDMMKNFDKGIVKFIDNYDGTQRMPEVLPVKFPSILTYAQSGIGVGFSSSTLSFNPEETCKALIKFIETGEKTILVPDFATGGKIVKDDAAFEKINFEGNGTVKLRGKAEINGNKLNIYEIPYTTTREHIIDKVVELSRAGKLKEVTNIQDLTGLKGMNISVTARRDTDMNMLLEKLYKFTPLESTASANMNILVDDLPKVLGVWPLMERWLEWRRECIERGLKFDVQKMSEKLHLLRGLEKVLLDIDKAIDIIRKSKEEEIESNLSKHFKIDHIQAEEVANMKLRNINKEFIVKKIKDIDALEKQIETYKKMIGNQKSLNLIVIKGLNETIQKHSATRRTEIVSLENVKPIKLEEHVPNYNVTVHLTKEGYCYKFKGDKEPTLKPGDEVIRVFETTNDAELLIFTTDRTCYKYEINKIEETKANQLGTYLPNVLRDESINIFSYSVLDKEHKILIAAYSNNRLAKINLESFAGNRKMLKNAYCHSQELVELLTLKQEATLKLITDRAEIIYSTDKLSLTNSRNATGVYATRKGELVKIEVA